MPDQPWKIAAIKIVAATVDTAAFDINSARYYIQIRDFPQIYDAQLKPLIIPNIDHWLQAQTKQRHSYRNLVDMVSAFLDGVESRHVKEAHLLCTHAMATAFRTLFQSKYLHDYLKAYNIESMDEPRFRKLLAKISSDHEKYHQAWGLGFINLLNRLHRYCMLHCPSEAAVVEVMMKIYETEPRAPAYQPIECQHEVISEAMLKMIGLNDEANEALDMVNKLSNREHTV